MSDPLGLLQTSIDQLIYRVDKHEAWDRMHARLLEMRALAREVASRRQADQTSIAEMKALDQHNQVLQAELEWYRRAYPNRVMVQEWRQAHPDTRVHESRIPTLAAVAYHVGKAEAERLFAVLDAQARL